MTHKTYFNGCAADALTFSTGDHGRDFPLGRYFILSEFQCNDGTDIVLVHPLLIVLLNDLRAFFGVLVVINSGYRTESYNESMGGAPQSRHRLGMAADVVVFNTAPD